MPNGIDNANTKKYEGVVLEKGKLETFTVVFNEIYRAGDLQYKAIKVKWNDTFKEYKLSAIEGGKIEMNRDPTK